MQLVTFVPYEIMFPNESYDFDEFKNLLATLDKVDLLFWCAKLNLIVSHPINQNRTGQQIAAIQLILNNDQQKELKKYLQGKPNVIVFFRGQLLELIRWACLFGGNFPNQSILASEETRTAFAKTLFISGELWGKRVFSPVQNSENEQIRDAWQGSFRQSLFDSSFHANPYEMIARSKKLSLEFLVEFYPEFPQIFHSQTNLTLEEYYTCLSVIFANYWNLSNTDNVIQNGEIKIFSLEKSFSEHSQFKGILTKFLALEGAKLEDFSTSLWKNNNANSLSEIAPYDYRPFRNHPIFYTDDDRAIVIDPQFCIEKATVGSLFHVLSSGIPTFRGG